MSDFARNTASSLVSWGVMYYFMPQIAKRTMQGVREGFVGSSSDMRGRVGDTMIEFMDGMSIAMKSEKFQKAMKGLGNTVGENSYSLVSPINDAVGKLFDDFLKNISFAVLTKWVPTLVVWALASVGAPLTLKYLYERAVFHLGSPKLMLEEHTITWLTPLYSRCKRISDYILRRPPNPKPIFHADLARRMDEIIAATVNILKNNGFQQNLILYGPGGTGKTMIAKEIARQSGMNWRMMSGADLAQFIKCGSNGGSRAVSELTKMLRRAYRSRRPTVIFIDEVDALARRRDQLDQEHREILNALLQQTGEPNKKVMIICATNLLNEIDPAFLSRMDNKLYVPPPGYSERFEILDMYIDRLFGSKSLERQFFTRNQLRWMALRTSGLTGRTLFKLVNAIYCKKFATANNRLSQRLVHQTIADFVQQERDMPDAVRSWRIVEFVSDFFLFTIPSFFLRLWEAIQKLGEAIQIRISVKGAKKNNIKATRKL